jgi:hypothetical protein
MALETYLQEGNEKKLMMLITVTGQLERDLFPAPQIPEPYRMAQELTNKGYLMKPEDYVELKRKIDNNEFDDIYNIGRDFENGASFIEDPYGFR